MASVALKAALYKLGRADAIAGADPLFNSFEDDGEDADAYIDGYQDGCFEMDPRGRPQYMSCEHCPADGGGCCCCSVVY